MERSVHPLNLNGKSAQILQWIMTGVIAALVGYYTALGATRERLTAVETREQAHFEEIQRTLADLKADLREVKTLVQRPVIR